MRAAWAAVFLVACRPYQPPSVTPVLVAARAPARVVRAEGNGGISLVVRSGWAYDPPGREGLAVAVAVVVSQRLGASVEAGPELMSFELPDSAASAVDTLTAPVSTSELEYAQSKLASFLRSRECAIVAEQVGMAWVFAGHPYGHGFAGRVSTIPTLTAAELSSFLASRYVRDAVVVAVNDATTVPPAIEAAFAPRLSRSPTPAPLPRTARPRMVVEAPVLSACAFVGLPVDAQTTPDVQAFSAFAEGQDWVHAADVIDPLGWAIIPVTGTLSLDRELDGLAGRPVGMATDRAPTANPMARQVLLSGVQRIRPEAPITPVDPSEWAREHLRADRLQVVLVTPDAREWRAAESSGRVVVLDTEAVLR